MPIDKTYNPADAEAKLYERWEQSGAFACDPNSKKPPFCIMMPPPNVTGSLHMGHALTFTLQDVLVRYRRMRGDDVLWQPGTDHAGIATQMVVERQLATSGSNESRREMGREAFLKKVWEWKEESGGTITRQLRRLGASCDWGRERFTMDPALNRAVNKVFVQLYREKLIYKDKRLVNWDPKMLTAVSDLEVEPREVKGNLWHFKYPIEGSEEFITIATTRPETLLGDTAVAVHPDDPRTKHLIGRLAVLPLVGRKIPIVGDEYADPEKGTGAVKITPAHDFNDFEVGRRHKLPMINIFDEHARLNAEVPEKYRGLDRFEARKRIVADMEELGLLEKTEPHTHAVPHGDRSGIPIEPWLSEQWYCDAHRLAQPAIAAVEKGDTKFVPEQWANTYFAWMRKIEPWCISRQLWWGHQIPAWYHIDIQTDGSALIDLTKMNAPFRGHGRDQSQYEYIVEETEDAALKAVQAKYPNSEVCVVQNHVGALALLKEGKVGIWRDEDVLDTWFSSALWPFSTLGWPQETPELKRYYPTDVLVTGHDIIFFWVARMMMQGLHFMKMPAPAKAGVPFRKVYIHALVLDEKGQKMSKTKGNVIDPLDIIGKYGCDALRFTLANMSTPGRNIRLATSRIEGNRNFATKLWNAARYCQMNECAWQEGFDPAAVKHTLNKWIVGETKLAADKIAQQLDDYRFDLSSSSAYEFVWNNFCDWYLEFTKPLLAGGDEAVKAETRATTAWVLGQMLHILHPFMPYITEELWGHVAGEGKMLMTSAWPQLADRLVDKNAQAEIGWVIRLVSTIRGIRSELNVPPGAQVQLQLKDANKETCERLERHRAIIMRLARVADIKHVTSVPKGAAQAVLDETTLILPLADVIDLAQESARLKKESEKWAAEIRKLDSKLGNESFVSRAPPEVVEEQRERKTEAEAMLTRLRAAQKSLSV